MSKLPEGWHYRAIVKLCIGRRGVCKLITSLDLGIEGIGEERVTKIDYKPGEIVDKERIENTLIKMTEVNKEQDADWIIFGHEVISIILVPNKEQVNGSS